ncbi:MAG: superoxide dismutase [Candidatus Sumerlaeales bacterium]|nr:superoxide dismutase [Candidatus Sumerlaeales bacterium]
MSFTLPPLPFSYDELGSFLSREQLMFHHDKHHNAYIVKLNGLIEGKTEETHSLRQLVTESTGALFNNAAQAWNHEFFWNCLSPNGTGKPEGELAAAILKDFGSFDEFKKQFSDKAVGLFGSGWCWLVADSDGKLEIMALSNADTPLKYGKEPILTLDVWEHAYYVDYRNERPRYVAAFWDKVNWAFAQECYQKR